MKMESTFWQTMMELAETGSKGGKTLTGILCTFDTLKRDAEIKLLIGCTLEDVETIQGFNSDMATLFIPNPMVEYDLSG